jgi:hypothetical protein
VKCVHERTHLVTYEGAGPSDSVIVYRVTECLDCSLHVANSRCTQGRTASSRRTSSPEVRTPPFTVINTGSGAAKCTEG